jgi:hypothetical protein
MYFSSHCIQAMDPFIVSAEAEQTGNILAPSDMDGHRKDFEVMGLSFGELVKDNPNLIHAELPVGWDKAQAGPFWYIRDQNGRQRGIIFRKSISPNIYQMRPIARLRLQKTVHSKGYASVTLYDCDYILDHEVQPFPGPHHNDFLALETAEKSLLARLEKDFPNWRDPLAYWEFDDLTK